MHNNQASVKTSLQCLLPYRASGLDSVAELRLRTELHASRGGCYTRGIATPLRAQSPVPRRCSRNELRGRERKSNLNLH